MGHLMRIKLTREGLLASHYTTRGAIDLGINAMKECSIFLIDAKLKPCHQMQFGVNYRASFFVRDLIPL